MANAYKRPGSPFWWVRYSEAGRCIRESTGIEHNDCKFPPRDSTVREIIRAIEDRIARKKFGLPAVVAAKTVREFFTEWIRSQAHWRGNTVLRYEQIGRHLADWCEANKLSTVADIDRAAAARFVDESKLSRVTLRNNLSFYRSAWNEARLRNHCVFTDNPWAIKVVALPMPTKKRAFTDEEIKKLLAMEAPTWMHLMIRISLYTGARIESLKALSWEFIGVDLGVINFPKTKTSPYSIAIHSSLADYLRPLAQKTGPVLPADVLKRSECYISRRFVDWATRAGVDGSYHMLRHTFLTKLAVAGVEKRITMLLANHSSDTVHAGYVHADALALKDDLEKVKYL